MLELLKSIDAFALGSPLLILLVGTGDLPNFARLGLLQVLRLPKAFQLIFTRTRGMEMYPVLRPSVQPWQRQLVREILSGWRQLSRSVDQEPLLDVDGGFLLGWLPSMRKAY